MWGISDFGKMIAIAVVCEDLLGARDFTCITSFSHHHNSIWKVQSVPETVSHIPKSTSRKQQRGIKPPSLSSRALPTRLLPSVISLYCGFEKFSIAMMEAIIFHPFLL
jgi:hypothetical protein